MEGVAFQNLVKKNYETFEVVTLFRNFFSYVHVVEGPQCDIKMTSEKESTPLDVVKDLWVYKVPPWLLLIRKDKGVNLALCALGGDKPMISCIKPPCRQGELTSVAAPNRDPWCPYKISRSACVYVRAQVCLCWRTCLCCMFIFLIVYSEHTRCFIVSVGST